MPEAGLTMSTIHPVGDFGALKITPIAADGSAGYPLIHGRPAHEHFIKHGLDPRQHLMPSEIPQGADFGAHHKSKKHSKK
jgi:hypothetical protein